MIPYQHVLPAGPGWTPGARRHAALPLAQSRRGVPSATEAAGAPAVAAPAVQGAATFGGASPTTALPSMRIRCHPARAAASTTPRPHGANQPTPVGHRHLQAWLAPWGLCRSRLGRAWEPPPPRPSQQGAVATMVLALVSRRLSGNARHALAGQPSGAGAACARVGMFGRRMGPARHGPRVRGGPNTGLQWGRKAAAQRQALRGSGRGAVPVRPLQLEAVEAVIRALSTGESRRANARKRLEGSRHWGWTVLAPGSTLRLGMEGGPRTVAMAQRGGHRVAQC
jgi:hypothetical protein